MSAELLARPEIRALRPYTTSPANAALIRLNANESPAAVGSGAATGINRYPSIRPTALTQKLAAHYAVAVDNILVTRGSSEGIDLLLRTFCNAGKDSVLLTPPVFELYEIYAAVQGAKCIRVPLQSERDFTLDTDALLEACNENTKLIFLCSPNNPVGSAIPHEQILRIVKARAGRSIVVVDEAYIEFSEQASLATMVAEYDNLVVLRTLSKALALAGARCGSVIAPAWLVELLQAVLAPYAISSPVIRCADRALSEKQLTDARRQINDVVAERGRLRAELDACDIVQRVWPSEANFLLVRFSDLARVARTLERAGIVIRTFGDDPTLRDCARITVASPAENDQLIKALRGLTC